MQRGSRGGSFVPGDQGGLARRRWSAWRLTLRWGSPCTGGRGAAGSAGAPVSSSWRSSYCHGLTAPAMLVQEVGVPASGRRAMAWRVHACSRSPDGAMSEGHHACWCPPRRTNSGWASRTSCGSLHPLRCGHPCRGTSMALRSVAASRQGAELDQWVEIPSVLGRPRILAAIKRQQRGDCINTERAQLCGVDHLQQLFRISGIRSV